MSKKDYKLIASALATTKPTQLENEMVLEYTKRLNVWKDVVTEISRGLASDNYRFNNSVFLEACDYYD